MEDPIPTVQSTEEVRTESPALSAPVEPVAQSQSQSQARSDEIQEESVRSSVEDVWYLKEIWFPGGTNGEMRPYRIITQNFNGPCSFIAICNILILRENIHILPPSRTSVSYEFLSQLVAEYLLLNSPDVDISMALTMMPLTTKGMDLNPLFTSPTAFRPTTSLSSLSLSSSSSSSMPVSDGALELFTHAGIKLVHGWLVDPESPEYETIKRLEDYDSAVNLIVEADVLTQGQLVVSEDFLEGQAGSSSGPTRGTTQLNEAERKKVHDAVMARSFLDTTQSQLTYHGLFTLASNSAGKPSTTFHSNNPFETAQSEPGPSTNPFASSSSNNPFHTSHPPEDVIPPNTLVALFRNSHLSVLYKHAPSSPPPSQSSPASSSDLFASHVKSGSSPSSPPSHLIPPAESLPGDERPSALYTLVTDQVFLHEPSVVWEKLEDVDQSAAVFVDAEFKRSTPMGGDFAGVRWSEDHAPRENADEVADTDPDRALARRLQAEEDAYARQMRARQQHQQQEAERQRQLEIEWQEQYAQRRTRQDGRDEGKGKKKKDCLIM